MLFNSAVFIFIFLPLVFFGYYLVRPSCRNIFLLLSSLFFYAWGEHGFIFVMIASIIFNYIIGLMINATHLKYIVFEKILFAIGIIGNIGLLFYFKYFSFFILNLNKVFDINFSEKKIVLPVGISFFTFQSISYLFDLHRREIYAQKNPLSLALYISMFPQLISGPIVRYADILSQIDNRTTDIEKIVYGIQRFIIGLSKKLLIADTLGEVADKIFFTPYTQINSATAWAGAICYMMQIFFDFSGYSDMAIGLGKIFVFDFKENFNLPYISKSITEFWRRWHISLSTWFRDYVYIPLGGSRTGNVYVNLIIVFAACGIWHGASWNFIFWGLWHGFFLSIERVLKNFDFVTRVPAAAKHTYAILAVLIGWILFRSSNIVDAYYYLSAMLNLIDHEFIRFSVWYYLDAQVIVTLIVAILINLPFHAYLLKISKDMFTVKYPLHIIKLLFLLGLMILNIIFVINRTYSPFIYFRF